LNTRLPASGVSLVCLTACLFAASIAGAEPLSGRALTDALVKGGYVLVMRHASSPREKPDAAAADPDNVELERQLDQTGRATARAMGEAIDALGIKVGRVLSSPAYRARETVRLAGLGDPMTFPELGEGEEGMSATIAKEQAEWLRALAAEVPAPGSDTFIITHTPNLMASFGADAEGVAAGEALVFEPDGDGDAMLVARIEIEDWPSLAALAGEAEASGETAAQAVPEQLKMGGEKSVMSFFITSEGPGRGGDLGGLAGADAKCQALAEAEYAGDHTWRAYLSTQARDGAPAVNARDRIGAGPWYNAAGTLIAANLHELHEGDNRIDKQMALTEHYGTVGGVGDDVVMHDILTGSRPDGTAFPPGDDMTCGNWTSSDAGRAMVGHHDLAGSGQDAGSWNSAHPTPGCSQQDFSSTGGGGLFYCFAID
jgi:phosphohistidine phosphatase SixA